MFRLSNFYHFTNNPVILENATSALDHPGNQQSYNETTVKNNFQPNWPTPLMSVKYLFYHILKKCNKLQYFLFTNQLKTILYRFNVPIICKLKLNVTTNVVHNII